MPNSHSSLDSTTSTQPSLKPSSSSTSSRALTNYLTTSIDKALTTLDCAAYAKFVEQQGLSHVSPYVVAPALKPEPLCLKKEKTDGKSQVCESESKRGSGSEKGKEKTTRAFGKRSTEPIQRWMELSKTATAEGYEGRLMGRMR